MYTNAPSADQSTIPWDAVRFAAMAAWGAGVNGSADEADGGCDRGIGGVCVGVETLLAVLTTKSKSLALAKASKSLSGYI